MRKQLVLAATLGFAVSTGALARAGDAKASADLGFAPFRTAKKGDWSLRKRTVDEGDAAKKRTEFVLVEVVDSDAGTLTIKTTRETYQDGATVGEPAHDERKVARAEASLARLLDAEPRARFELTEEKTTAAGRELACTKAVLDTKGSKIRAWLSKDARSGVARLSRTEEKAGKTIATEDELVGQGSKDATDWGKTASELRKDLASKPVETASKPKASPDDDEPEAEPGPKAKKKRAKVELPPEEKVTLALKDVSIETVVRIVAAGVGVDAPVVVDPALAKQKVSLNLSETPISEVWEFLHDISGARVDVRDGKILVTKQP